MIGCAERANNTDLIALISIYEQFYPQKMLIKLNTQCVSASMWWRKETYGFIRSSCFYANGIINSIDFTYDEKHVVVGGFSCPTVKLFNIKSGKCVAEYRLDGAWNTHGSISCCDDHIAVIEGSGSVLKLLDLDTLKVLPFNGGTLGHVETLAYDSVSQRLLVGYRSFVNRKTTHNMRLFDRKGDLVAEIDVGLNIYAQAWTGNKIVVVGSRREHQGRPQIAFVDPESGIVTCGDILAASRVDHVELCLCNEVGLIFVSMRVNEKCTCSVISIETMKVTLNLDMGSYTCRKLQYIPMEKTLVALIDAGHKTGTLGLEFAEKNSTRTLINRGASGISLAKSGNRMAIAFGKKVEVYDRKQ